MSRYTNKQGRTLSRIADGAKVYAYLGWDGRTCFRSDADGMRAIIYLTATMRALCERGAVSHAPTGEGRGSQLCTLTREGRANVL